MSTIENYDGLCGIPHLYASSDCQVKCTYEAGHGGKHSWENKWVGLGLGKVLPGWASTWFAKYCKK